MATSWLGASLMVRTSATSLSLLTTSSSMVGSTSSDWGEELKHALRVENRLMHGYTIFFIYLL